MNKSLIIACAFMLLLVYGCKGTKNPTTKGDEVTIKVLNKNMEAAAFDAKWLSAKARVAFDDGNINQTFTANIRMKKDEVIWMSLTGPFGIEGGRVLITQDTIQIIDRLNRDYYKEPFDYIRNFIPIDADIALLQQIILGNPLQKSLSKQKLEQPTATNNYYTARGDLGGIAAIYQILPDIFKYKNVNLRESGSARTLDMSFNDYKKVEEQYFAHDRQMKFKDESKNVSVGLDFNKVKKETSLEFPFSVPSKYTNQSER